MFIHADKGRCVGAGMCVLNAPSLFSQSDEDGIVEVLHQGAVSAESQRDALMAVDACPSRAIELTERR
jgi:ferredoxin